MTAFLQKLVLFSALAGSLSAAPLLTLDPASGNLQGSPGQTVGWGFSIDNDTSLYLVITSVTPNGFSFVPGSFQDYLVSLNFYVVDPNSTLPVAFDFPTTQGFGAYQISAGANPGDIDSGSFGVTYDLFVNDPNDPGFQPDARDVFGNTFDPVSASVEVVSDVPEPSTALLLLAGLGLLWKRR